MLFGEKDALILTLYHKNVMLFNAKLYWSWLDLRTYIGAVAWGTEVLRVAVGGIKSGFLHIEMWWRNGSSVSKRQNLIVSAWQLENIRSREPLPTSSREIWLRITKRERSETRQTWGAKFYLEVELKQLISSAAKHQKHTKLATLTQNPPPKAS